jgi:hypothetical protein
MVYKPNVPLITDRISKSQKNFRENFQRINEFYNIDHVNLTGEDDVEQGLHNQMTMPEQSGDPGTAADERALYSKDDGSGNTLIYTQAESSGAVQPVWGPQNMVQGGGLRLEAWCAFKPTNGDFLQVGQVQKGTDELKPTDVKSFNVTSVTAVGQTTFTINIDSNYPLSSADYLYTVDVFSTQKDLPSPLTNLDIRLTAQNNAGYASTCTTTKLVLESRTLNASPNVPWPIDGVVSIIYTSIWTVA